MFLLYEVKYLLVYKINYFSAKDIQRYSSMSSNVVIISILKLVVIPVVYFVCNSLIAV